MLLLSRKLPSLALRPADNLCPLKVGDELFIDAPDAAFNAGVRFHFDVALHEPDIIKPRSVMEVARQLSDLVNLTVEDFKPLLS